MLPVGQKIKDCLPRLLAYPSPSMCQQDFRDEGGF